MTDLRAELVTRPHETTRPLFHHLEGLLQLVDRDGVVIDWDSAQSRAGTPTVSTAVAAITRGEAERLLRVLLRRAGLSPCRCKWKRPWMVMSPV